MKIKQGDKVIIRDINSCRVGKTGIAISQPSGNNSGSKQAWYVGMEQDAVILTFWEADLELLKNNINCIMKITNLVKKILDKDTRTLVSAGFINGELALTDEGVAELLGILFLQNKDELVKIANEKITDETKG